MRSDLIDLLRVGLTGTAGSLATLKLGDVHLLMSIAVGAITFLYVATKLVLLLRGRHPPAALD